jgi:hypothetical protein
MLIGVFIIRRVTGTRRARAVLILIFLFLILIRPWISPLTHAPSCPAFTIKMLEDMLVSLFPGFKGVTTKSTLKFKVCLISHFRTFYDIFWIVARMLILNMLKQLIVSMN